MKKVSKKSGEGKVKKEESKEKTVSSVDKKEIKKTKSRKPRAVTKTVIKKDEKVSQRETPVSSKKEEKIIKVVKEHKVSKKEKIHKTSSKTKVKTKDVIPVEKEVVVPRKIEEESAIPLQEKVEKIEVHPEVIPTKKKISIDISKGLTPKEISDITNIPVSNIVATLMKLGSIVSATQKITDPDTIEILLSELGFEIEHISQPAQVEKEVLYKQPSQKVEELEATQKVEGKVFIKKVPVVTIMGHVDHGKTTLLDTIRKSNIAANEYGFITQHIGAYKVKTPNGDITFIDTPGHEAFSSLRARGTSVTDIVIIVVAGDEGVMPQTVEAINHAKLAKVPIIVAVNKMDLAGFNSQKVRQQFSEYGILAHDWGGDVEFVEISARNNINIDKLLETVLLQAEVMELKAAEDVPGRGVVIETKLDSKRGSVATVIVMEGKLKIGDSFVVGTTWGKIRAMISDTGERLEEVLPGEPTEIIGFEELPKSGDVLVVVSDERQARKFAELEKEKGKKNISQQKKKLSFEDIISGKSKVLSLVIKTDAQGSMEAIKKMLDKMAQQAAENPEAAELKVVHYGVGEITESDVLLSSAGNSIIVGFNVRPTTQAIKLAKHEGVEIKTYRTIYDLSDEVEKILKGLEVKKEREEFLGRALVRKVFNISKVGKVAGCFVEEGKIVRNAKVRLLRDNVIIAETKISSLKRFKEDVKEVEKGYECGIGLENVNDIRENDVIESYQIVVES